jgi:2-phospho-L-lactate guanylyltransferase
MSARAVVAVPVKDLASAKQRLARVLTAAERAALARAMLHDVLAALDAAPFDEVWLVTRDPEATAVGRALGARVLAEPDNRGHTAAVALARAEAERAGVALFATVPGDLPGVTPSELTELLATAAAAEPPAAVFAPSRSGLGTNAVVLAPPAAMPLTFGEPSFENHLAAARARGLAPHVVRRPGLGLDVDGPEDLMRLVTEAATTRSGRLVASWRIDERLLRVARAR